MRVDGDRRYAVSRRNVAQMLAERRLVDRKIARERQQDRRNDAVGKIFGHGLPSALRITLLYQLHREFPSSRCVSRRDGRSTMSLQPIVVKQPALPEFPAP